MVDNISVVLLTAGCGSKTKSFGNKSLLSYAKTPIIIKQIKNIYKVFPQAEIVVVLGYEGQRLYAEISAKFPSIKYVYNSEYTTTGQTYSILLGMMAASHDNILLIYGDIIFNFYTINRLKVGQSCAICDNRNQIRKDKVGVTYINSVATVFQHGLKTKWTQLVLLTKKEIDIAKQLFLTRESYKWFGYEMLNYILKHGGRINVVEFSKQNVLEINSMSDLES